MVGRLSNMIIDFCIGIHIGYMYWNPILRIYLIIPKSLEIIVSGTKLLSPNVLDKYVNDSIWNGKPMDTCLGIQIQIRW
jgi:hypothetical protein